MTDPIDQAWRALDEFETATLVDLFAAEPDRLSRLVVEEAGIRFDFAKTHLSRAALNAFIHLADATGLAERREALFAGEIVNPTENRAAEHAAERGEGAAESIARARRF